MKVETSNILHVIKLASRAFSTNAVFVLVAHRAGNTRSRSQRIDRSITILIALAIEGVIYLHVGLTSPRLK